jgi:glucose-1-phosphate thymidylyltransferase
MVGIILAGGKGTRLWPSTKVVSKQLLPVFDKPLIYYPLATLMLAGIRDIIIVVNPGDLDLYEALLGAGNKLGINIRYVVQTEPRGIADAFNVCKEYISGKSVCLILGDNIFHGNGMGNFLSKYTNPKGAQIFAYKVSNPGEYGVVEFDSTNSVISIEEKPISPRSNYGIPGLYFYDSQVCEIAKSLKPSSRGELEISDVNRAYLISNELHVEILPRGTAWLDTGMHETLHDAGTYIRIMEERQSYKIACIEEIAWRKGWIDSEQVCATAMEYGQNNYGNYLREIVTVGYK